MDFDGLKEDIVEMLADGRAKVNTTKFSNDLSDIRSRDDVLTVLICVDYLAFDWKKRECNVPNYEESEELANTVEDMGWIVVANALPPWPDLWRPPIRRTQHHPLQRRERHGLCIAHRLLLRLR